MTTEPIRILCLSDVHFGIASIDQHGMADAFASTIFPLLKDTDIVCINGDFFDGLVIFDNVGFDPIYMIIMALFRMCEEHNVILRVLQGTWTHDRNQCKRLCTFYKNGRFTFDFKFMEGISFETITVRDRSLRFLYVQDDLPYKSSEEAVAVINERMIELGWDYVDYACMHGFFEFTFPKNVNQKNRIVFKESQFDFVRKAIDVGHVHEFRQEGKCISNGSLDRLVHGDEIAKGCVLINDYPDKYKATFIKNEKALIFNTLSFRKDDTTESIRTTIDDHIRSLNTDRTIHLRFIVDDTSQYDAIKTWMRDAYPDVIIKRKTNDKSDGQPVMITSSDLITDQQEIIAPNRNTIATYIKAHLPEECTLSVEDIENHLCKDTI